MDENSVSADCAWFMNHEFTEEYYGYVCKKCGLFIPYGSEPWMPFDPDDTPEAYYGEYIGDE